MTERRSGARRPRPRAVRVRFPPSPTGNLHVGNVRSALFNWAFARHYGGTLRASHRGHRPRPQHPGGLRRRSSTSLRWLGIDWDEGPEVGGAARPVPPVRAVRHLPRRRRAAAASPVARLRLLLHQRGGRGAPQGVRLQDPGVRRLLPRPHRRAGRRPSEPRDAARSCASGCPTAPITFDDLVRGEVTFQPEHVPDFALVRANGDPLYTLVNPVDDALMGITHVLRGEDLLSSTPRQIALYEALEAIGIGTGPPRFGHLPIVMGEGNKRLSKRDAGLRPARSTSSAASCPRGCSTTSPCSAGRSPRTATCSRMRGDGRGLRHPPGEPQPGAVRPEEGRGHQRRAHAAAQHRGARASGCCRSSSEADLVEDPPTPEETAARSPRACVLIHERSARSPRAPTCSAFLFLDEVVYDEADVAKVLDDDGLAGRRRRPRGARRARRLDDRGHRRGAARQARRGARPQAPQRLRPGAGRRDRSPGLAAAVRVPRAARPRGVAGPARRGTVGCRDRRPVAELMSYPGPTGPQQPPPPPRHPARPRRGRPSPAPATGAARRAAGWEPRMVAHPHPEPRTLPADAAHLGLPLVEAGRRHPAARVVALLRGADRCCCRCSPSASALEGGSGTVRRPVRELPLSAGLGHAVRRCSTST